jgi:exopolyphosphatase/guanosine-5'-triphosphate,3'-diphosphate pyrophosphatase
MAAVDTPVLAAIDVGSTSVHLLVAAVGDRALEPLVDESAFLGLGAAVDTRGVLGRAPIDALVAALRGFAAEAAAAGATAPTIVATEPLRRALDAARAVRAVEHEAGLALHVLSHREEALLTLIGVTGGRPPDAGLVVVDVGGGSTEVVVARPGGAPIVAGLAVGAARLGAAVRRPPAGRVGMLLDEARRVVRAAPDAAPAELVAVGGTADNLRRVAAAAAPAGRLTRDRLRGALALLASEPPESVAARFAVRPERARLLPAGGAILLALLDRYGLDAIRVSEAGMRDGTILAAALAGAGWRDALERLATGSPPPARACVGTPGRRRPATGDRPSA